MQYSNSTLDFEPLRSELTEMRRQISQLVAGQAEMLVSIVRVREDVSAFTGSGAQNQGARGSEAKDKTIDADAKIEKMLNTILATQLKKEDVYNSMGGDVKIEQMLNKVLATQLKKEDVDHIIAKAQEAEKGTAYPHGSAARVIAPVKAEPGNIMVGKQPSEYNNDNIALPTRGMSTKSIAKSEEEMKALQTIITVAEKQESIRFETTSFKQQHGVYAYYKEKFDHASLEQYDLGLDSVMGSVICMNAVFIGLSMDYATDGFGPWLLVDMLFSAIFLTELAIKIRMHTFLGHFCGPQSKANCFDFTLILIDTLQTSIILISPAAANAMDEAPSASLFRIIRLVKLTRLLRLLRREVFKDLMSMVQGMIGGMSTLGWAMVLYFMMVYVMALLFRELLGRKEKEHIYDIFSSVPRSMFTTFRCSFGDCSTAGGAPLFEQVRRDYGAFHTVFYCIFAFTVTIGLFNVISAIFVESTMAAAMALQSEKKAARLQDESLWSTAMNVLIQRIMDVSPDYNIPGKMSDSLKLINSVTVTRDIIDIVAQDADAIAALDSLDIDREDHRYLSDILDPDNSGLIPINDFVDGIRRLRGDPRRSDIVTVDLMIRAIQGELGGLSEKIGAIHDNIFPPVPGAT